MAIITTLEVFQKYVSVSGTLNLTTINPFIEDAQENYLREFLGETLLVELNDYAEDPTKLPTWTGGGEAASLNKLLPYVQCALAKFALVLASPSLDLKVTDGGFSVTLNQNMAPASSDRVKRFTDGMLKQGYDNIETLLRYLEKYKVSYPSWVAGEGYTIHTKYFINSADEFNKHVDIGNSRLRFRAMRTTMENVEMLQVEPVISTELAAVIKTQVKDCNLSPANLKILLYIRKAVANLTYYEYGLATENLPNNNSILAVEQAKIDNNKRLGDHYLAEVKKVLDANPSDYPDYTASSVYDSAKTSNDLYENTSESSFFVMGG